VPAPIDLAALVRSIPDFPVPGIVFRDITPLLADAAALDATVLALAAPFRDASVELVLAPEARGFILGGALARELCAGFVPARKPGRLPARTLRAEYELEYGMDALELHADALARGARVLVHDDLLATGGTGAALCELVERAGAEVVGCTFVVELRALGGRARLAAHQVRSLIGFD